jgi:hypothetical protein
MATVKLIKGEGMGLRDATPRPRNGHFLKKDLRVYYEQKTEQSDCIVFQSLLLALAWSN